MTVSLEQSQRKKYGCAPRLLAAAAMWEPASLATNVFNIPAAGYVYPNFVSPMIENLVPLFPWLPVHLIGFGATAYFIGKAATVPVLVGAFIVGPEVVEKVVSIFNRNRQKITNNASRWLNRPDSSWMGNRDW